MWMFPKGKDSGSSFTPELPGFIANLFQNGVVAAMQAVKHAHGEHKILKAFCGKTREVSG